MNVHKDAAETLGWAGDAQEFPIFSRRSLSHSFCCSLQGHQMFDATEEYDSNDSNG